MGILLVEAFKTGTGFVAAHAYGACCGQALVFSTVNRLVDRILHRLVFSYIQNTFQFGLIDIAIQATSGLAGVLMTRLFCEKTIHWKTALASSVISDAAFMRICPLIMKPISFESIFSNLVEKNA